MSDDWTTTGWDMSEVPPTSDILFGASEETPLPWDALAVLSAVAGLLYGLTHVPQAIAWVPLADLFTAGIAGWASLFIAFCIRGAVIWWRGPRTYEEAIHIWRLRVLPIMFLLIVISGVAQIVDRVRRVSADARRAGPDPLAPMEYYQAWFRYLWGCARGR